MVCQQNEAFDSRQDAYINKVIDGKIIKTFNFSKTEAEYCQIQYKELTLSITHWFYLPNSQKEEWVYIFIINNENKDFAISDQTKKRIQRIVKSTNPVKCT